MSASPATVYRPLARMTVRFRGLHRLYAAADHVLAVNDQISTEEYRRFYFSDIQVLTVGRTHHGKILNAVIGFLAFVMFMAAVGASGSEGVVIFGVLTAVIVVALVLNIVAGPTAMMHVVTAVQTEQLRGIGRLRTARRVLAELEPLILAAQSGGVAPEAGGVAPGAGMPMDAGVPAPAPATASPVPETAGEPPVSVDPAAAPPVISPPS